MVLWIFMRKLLLILGAAYEETKLVESGRGRS